MGQAEHWRFYIPLSRDAHSILLGQSGSHLRGGYVEGLPKGAGSGQVCHGELGCEFEWGILEVWRLFKEGAAEGVVCEGVTFDIERLT